MSQSYNRKAIKAAIQARGWTAWDLTCHLQALGYRVSYGSVRAWVSGKTVPSSDHLAEISNAFDCSPAEFFATEQLSLGGVCGK